MAQRRSPRLVTKLGEPSWRIASPDVEAFLARDGGQLGPTTFNLPGRRLQPFHVAPWAGERDATDLPVLRVLRGDFLCMPFGGGADNYRGERHQIHGETANRPWSVESVRRTAAQTTGHFSLRTRVRLG